MQGYCVMLKNRFCKTRLYVIIYLKKHTDLILNLISKDLHDVSLLT